ncbi:MAG: hypothetical protein EHM72_18510, partial [Calditrichaeota bacterium]
MSHALRQVLLGDHVPLDKIESVFRQNWREASAVDATEAVLKASTLNLLIYSQQRDQFDKI